MPECQSLGCHGFFVRSPNPIYLLIPLYCCSNLGKILVTISNIATKQKSNKLKDMMEKTEVIFKGFRIQPDSKVHVVWDVVAVLTIMYYSCSFPIRLALYIGSNSLRASHDLLFLLDYAIDFLFLLDLFLRLHVYAYVSYANGRNEVIVDRKQIKAQYIRSEWFAIDLLASIPWDIVSLGTGYYTLYRLPKLARIWQISPLISRLQKNLDECMQRTMTETQLSSIIMFLYSLLIIVWCSSGWNALRYGESGYHSVYWALTTLTTTGYGDQTPVNFRQTCYALFVGAAGATFSAAIIANVTSFFHDTEISEDNTEHKLNVVKAFMERHKCQHEHVKKVDDYFEYIEREQEGLNEDILLNKSIPDNLRSDMLIHITQSMVLGCDFFAECESGFIRRLMLSLEQRFFGKQYMVMTESTPADGMYFVKKGIVEILGRSAASVSAASDGTPGLKVTKRLEADDCFAEGCLLSHWETNPFLARAATDCELWFLSRSTFNRLVADFPRVRTLLSQRDAADVHLSSGRRASAHAILKAAAKARRSRAVFIHPDRPFMQGWVGLILLVTLYNAIALPLRVAFLENHTISSTWIALDYLCDLILVSDIVIRAAFVAYFNDNHLIVERDKIFQNYRRSPRMKWHMVAALPLEIITVFVPTMCPLWTLQVWSLFRLNKVLRLPEFSHLLSQVESTLAKKAGIKLPRNQLRVGKLIMVILISAHLVGCIFFVIANLNQHGAQGNVNAQRNWANSQGLLDPAPSCPGEAVDAHTVWQRYVAALFWSMATLTTVGYGDISAHEDSITEILFSSFVLVVGTAIYTLVIALLEDIVAQLDVTSTLFESKMNTVEAYMALQGLPEDMKLKVTAYYDNLWRHQLGVNGGKLLRYLPRSLRSDLLFDKLSFLLQQTFFVKDCSTDFVAGILRSMTLELYLADDIIFQEGERCDCLSFLYKGDVDLLTSNNVKFKTMSDCLLGESSFFGAEPFICTARAATTCEVFHLHLDDFQRQLADNHLLDKFTSYIRTNDKKLSKSKAAVENMIKNLNSSKMAKMLSIEDIQTAPKGIILPTSMTRRVWDTIALFFLLVLLFTVPFQISFSGITTVGEEVRVGGSIGLAPFIIDSIIDVFFIADIYFRATRFAEMRDGALVDDPKQFRLVYLKQGGFRPDVISSIPASLIAYFAAGHQRRIYGFLRLIQLVRVRRLSPYLDEFIDFYATKTGKTLSTAFLRVSQMFLGVLILCHWVACAFHLIGDASLSSSVHTAATGTSNSNWLIEDGMVDENAGGRYLRSFYWALYTTSTIGYGSVGVISIAERLFAMIAMVVGAVVCDAGITAVLTSIIINRDHQASTNSRRIQCTKCYMTSNYVPRDIQDRVLDYYSYTDTKLQNIDESSVLEDLSPSMRGQILSHFCFQPLRSSSLCEEFSDGAVMSLVKTMKPYIAIPGERIVEIGKESDAIYVLQRGLCTLQDSSSSNTTEHSVPIGAVFGHEVTAARYQDEGEILPSHGMRIEIVEASGIRSSKSGGLYMEFEHGRKSCRTSIKKNSSSSSSGRDWQEAVVLKYSQPPRRLRRAILITIKGWRRDGAHRIIGSAQVQVPRSEDTALQTLLVTDACGKYAGTLTLRISQYELPKDEIPTTHEETVVANGFCHLYRMDAFEITKLRDYLAKSNDEFSVIGGDSSGGSSGGGGGGADQSDFGGTSRRCSLSSATTCCSSIKSISEDEHEHQDEDGGCESTASTTSNVPAKMRLDLGMGNDCVADKIDDEHSTSRPTSTIMGMMGKRQIAPADMEPIGGNTRSRDNQWRGTLIKTGTIIQNKRKNTGKSSILQQRRLGTRVTMCKGRSGESSTSSGGSISSASTRSANAQEERDKHWDKLVDMSSAVARSSTTEGRVGKQVTAANIAARRRSFFVDWGR